ncbi:translation initiation factor eIF-5A [Hyphopichia burtonii NRRL Y-1933]|uniref:Translation initiation factor eIF-5A n=1 Tax=Hyphopichia burtonii NRRL Y-1933 TaxID=984485 RepID=A0A1E4RN42_9ASCO|nr:translation initiation factor eIF-5A [Hyphopichia burtonii NRRL Y-1933]ODV68656.1 translation initiation factor eIF-5A [Hyphopichia burtonii NRRL Y-1933]
MPTCSFTYLYYPVSDAGVDLTYPIQCSELRINDYVVIKERPCQIVDISKADEDNVHLVGTDIFTVPNVMKREYQLVDIEDDLLSLMTADGSTKDGIQVPLGDLSEDMRFGKTLLVTIMSAMGEEAAVSCNPAPRSDSNGVE